MSCDFFAGWVGGCAGILFGHPLDTLKVVILKMFRIIAKVIARIRLFSLFLEFLLGASTSAEYYKCYWDCEGSYQVGDSQIIYECDISLSKVGEQFHCNHSSGLFSTLKRGLAFPLISAGAINSG